MSQKQTVLRVGLEGGGLDLFRTRAPDGSWSFVLETSTIALDENDDDVWGARELGTFPSLEDALRRFEGDDLWLAFIPMEVHPAYRAAAWQFVSQQMQRLSVDVTLADRKRGVLAYWARAACAAAWNDTLRGSTHARLPLGVLTPCFRVARVPDRGGSSIA